MEERSVGCGGGKKSNIAKKLKLRLQDIDVSICNHVQMPGN